MITITTEHLQTLIEEEISNYQRALAEVKKANSMRERALSEARKLLEDAKKEGNAETSPKKLKLARQFIVQSNSYLEDFKHFFEIVHWHAERLRFMISQESEEEDEDDEVVIVVAE